MVLVSNGNFDLFLATLLMILFRQKYPRWWFDWNVALVKFGTRVATYIGLLTDVYPSTDEEQAVQNVTQLVIRLQVAGDLLDDAHNAYRIGDYDTAYSSASNCSSEALGIASQAASLKVQAEQASSNALFFTVTLSSVVLSVFFVLSLLGWRFLKNRYEKRVLGLRPELR
jgi:hypothetical protein